MAEQKRGQLTERVQQRSKQLMGREIDVTELRLMPYVQYVMMNEQRIDEAKLSLHDISILETWRDENHIEWGASEHIAVSKEFWDIINELVWLAYVDLSAE